MCLQPTTSAEDFLKTTASGYNRAPAVRSTTLAGCHAWLLRVFTSKSNERLQRMQVHVYFINSYGTRRE